MDSMKKKIAYLLLLLMLIPVGSFAKEKRTFEIKDGHFYVNGKVTPILSGEMHYPRIPHQYWRHRLRMMRAMGLNTVATYVFWNLHETEPGKWDFEGDKNLAEYIRIAGEEGLMVILRPGPYVCAEWEFGGYPWWLQNIPGMEIRRDNPEFLKRTKLYIDKLYEQVGDLQVSKGGPIIMVQAENEFGSYVAQRKDIPPWRSIAATTPRSSGNWRTPVSTCLCSPRTEAGCSRAVPPGSVAYGERGEQRGELAKRW